MAMGTAEDPVFDYATTASAVIVLEVALTIGVAESRHGGRSP